MGELRTSAHAYRVILASRLRAQRAYPVSFAVDLLGSLLTALVEFAEVWIIFHNVRSFGGLDFTQVMLLFGIAHTGFAAAQVVVGHVDRIPRYLRLGTMEAFYLRPLSLLGQLITSEIELRRLGWLLVGLVALGWGMVANDVAWTPPRLLLLVVCVLSAAAIFAALFVWAAGVQFFLVDGQEMTNAVTYGGRYASQQPTSIFPRPLLWMFAIAVPVAFTGYVPTLALLDLPAPAGAPWLVPELAWAAPLVAAWVWLLALASWRWGAQHYQGGGG